MTARLPMYEGDGFIRKGLTAQAVATLTVPSPEALADINREARRLRSEHVGKIIRAVIAWIGDIPRRARQDYAERFLAGATDHADVERRIRILERDRSRGWDRHLPA